MSGLVSQLMAYDPALAVRLHLKKMQNHFTGPDPMLEGAHDWPALTPATATLSPARPIRGWRMWAVLDVNGQPRLCAPFQRRASAPPNVAAAAVGSGRRSP